jgi:hypothetical protein
VGQAVASCLLRDSIEHAGANGGGGAGAPGWHWRQASF